MRLLFNSATGGGLGAVVGLTDDDIIDGFGDVDSYAIGNDFEDQTLDGAPTAIETAGLDTSTSTGRQVRFDVFTKLPESTAPGFYETDYEIQLGEEI